MCLNTLRAAKWSMVNSVWSSHLECERDWRKEKEAKKGLQLHTGKQTGSLFYLYDAIAKKKKKLQEEEVESEMGGFSTVLTFSSWVNTETCSAQDVLRLKCHIVTL